MSQKGFLMYLKAGAENEYKKRHEKLWPELESLLKSYGISNYSIFLGKKIYEAIKNDPYYNALQVKFSYVITCHKSQGGQWEQVIIEHPYLPDGPSPIYYKWLYTALTRASRKAYLLGFPPDWFDVS